MIPRIPRDQGLPGREEVLSIEFEKLLDMVRSNQQQVTVLAVKRHLQQVCGQTRFKQRLLLADGGILSDKTVLDGPMDAHLILLPFEASSHEHVGRLWRHARQNSISEMEQLLQRPQDPDLEIVHSQTPLHVASQLGRAEAVRLLLEAKADKDRENFSITPLYMASQAGYLDIVRLLLESHADKDKTSSDGAHRAPTHAAAEPGHFEIVRLLLEAKADKGTTTTA